MGIKYEDDKNFTVNAYVVNTGDGKVEMEKSETFEFDMKGEWMINAIDADGTDLLVIVSNSNGSQKIINIDFVYDVTKRNIQLKSLDFDGGMEKGEYIAKIVDTSTFSDTFYICYLEGTTSTSYYSESWVRRYVLNLDDWNWSQTNPITNGYFNGVAVMAIKDGKVIYKGHIESDISKSHSEAIQEFRKNDGVVRNMNKESSASITDLEISFSPNLR